MKRYQINAESTAAFTIDGVYGRCYENEIGDLIKKLRMKHGDRKYYAVPIIPTKIDYAYDYDWDNVIWIK